MLNRTPRSPQLQPPLTAPATIPEPPEALPVRRRATLAKTLTRSSSELSAVNQRRYSEGLVCSECGRLLASLRSSWEGRLTEAERAAFVCGECRQAKRD